MFACGDATLDESLTDLAVGDCIPAPDFTSGTIDSVDQVDCDTQGALKVIDRFELTSEDGTYPGDDAVEQETGAGCPQPTIYTLYPTQDSWEKTEDRLVVCFGIAAAN